MCGRRRRRRIGAEKKREGHTGNNKRYRAHHKAPREGRKRGREGNPV